MRCVTAKNLVEREPPSVIGNSSEKERRLGYFLRENPKKSWKFLGLKENAQENPCQVCDKRFRSMRALFCHMKIHSRKDGESSARCKDHGKGSGSVKPCRDHKRPIHDRETLNLSLLNKDRSVGSSKTKSGLLLIILSYDETMHITRRKRTPRIAYDVDEKTEGVLFSVPNESSYSSEAEQDLESVGSVSLMMISQRETDCNSSVEPFSKSLAPDFFNLGKGRITEASEGSESHSRGYSRMKREGIELEVPAGMLCGAREVGHKKPKAAKSGEEPMNEAAMMDHDAMGTAGSDSRERAELWIEPGLNSYRDEARAEESQVFGGSGKENKDKSRDAENYKQEALVDASQGIEGNHGSTKLKSMKDDSAKMNRNVCSISCMRSASLYTPSASRWIPRPRTCRPWDNGSAPDTGV